MSAVMPRKTAKGSTVTPTLNQKSGPKTAARTLSPVANERRDAQKDSKGKHGYADIEPEVWAQNSSDLLIARSGVAERTGTRRKRREHSHPEDTKDFHGLASRLSTNICSME